MSKKIYFIFSILIIFLIFLNLVSSAEQFDIRESEEFQKAEDAKSRITEFSAEDAKAEYLSREWTTWLRENGYLNWLYKANPIFKFFLGQEFSLSWAFIAAIIIFIGVASIYYQFLKLIVDNQIGSLAISVLIGVITTNTLTPKIIEYSGKVAKTTISAIVYIIVLAIIIYIIRTIIKLIIKKLLKGAEKKRIKKVEGKVDKTLIRIGDAATGASEVSRNWGSMNKYKK